MWRPKFLLPFAFAILGPAWGGPLEPMGAAAEGALSAGVLWTSGTKIQSEYKEMAGTLVFADGQAPVLRSNGRDYVLMGALAPLAEPPFKNKAAVIVKGIEAVVALPGRPVQHLVWPLECTVQGKRFVFPQAASDHGDWLAALVDPTRKSDRSPGDEP